MALASEFQSGGVLKNPPPPSSTSFRREDGSTRVLRDSRPRPREEEKEKNEGEEREVRLLSRHTSNIESKCMHGSTRIPG